MGYKVYCPKCGSTNGNAESIGNPGANSEPRCYWCIDCGHAQQRAFKSTPPKRLEYEAVEKRMAALFARDHAQEEGKQ